jgi:hypothetical protein
MDCTDNILTGRMIEAGGSAMGKVLVTLLIALMLTVCGSIVRAGPDEDGYAA